MIYNPLKRPGAERCNIIPFSFGLLIFEKSGILKYFLTVPINFFFRDIKFALKNKAVVKSWLETAIHDEKRTPGEINYIFCDDEYLLVLNQKYLKHKTLTDIITFDYNTEPKRAKKSNQDPSRFISGDIFISIPRVKENAKKFNTLFETELSRVLVHGILHLCGYKDKTPREKKQMRKKEEEHLAHLKLNR